MIQLKSEHLSKTALENISLEEIQSKLLSDGFFIIKDLIPKKTVEKLKIFWAKEFKEQSKSRPDTKSIRGNLHFGERDFDSYSDNAEWNIFRTFSFFWNESKSREHKITKEIASEVNGLRNLIEEEDVSRGITFDEAGYGVYLSVSHYPPSTGFLKFHSDGHPVKGFLLQYMININHKNLDYSDGGLYVKKDGKDIDVDAMLEPGSVLFFDGALEHGVNPVRSKDEIGRMAFFAIPTYFVSNSDVPDLVRTIEKIYLGVKRRFSKKKPSSHLK